MAWSWKDDDPKIIIADPSMFNNHRHRHDGDEGFKRWVRRKLGEKKADEKKKTEVKKKQEPSCGQWFALLTILGPPLGLLYFYLAAVAFSSAVTTLQAVLK